MPNMISTRNMSASLRSGLRGLSFTRPFCVNFRPAVGWNLTQKRIRRIVGTQAYGGMPGAGNPNAPDVTTTPGEAQKTSSGQAGGGSSATCIGC